VVLVGSFCARAAAQLGFWFLLGLSIGLAVFNITNSESDSQGLGWSLH
jgi:hypothetical protein